MPDNVLLSGTGYLPEGLKLTLPNFSGGFERLKQNGNELVMSFADKKMIEALDFTEQFKLEQEKDEAELKISDLRIKEVELRKATRRPIFSGSVFIRY